MFSLRELLSACHSLRKCAYTVLQVTLLLILIWRHVGLCVSFASDLRSLPAQKGTLKKGSQLPVKGRT